MREFVTEFLDGIISATSSPVSGHAAKIWSIIAESRLGAVSGSSGLFMLLVLVCNDTTFGRSVRFFVVRAAISLIVFPGWPSLAFSAILPACIDPIMLIALLLESRS